MQLSHNKSIQPTPAPLRSAGAADAWRYMFDIELKN